ncbi:MAG: methyl-accepting chemotaxis protein [Terasakiella sp.]|uniref:methyl-accepting chemotaxis protein n=1 Tax=unclassified Terasakiella TaxID=2614952 RepID=UPI003B0022B5
MKLGNIRLGRKLGAIMAISLSGLILITVFGLKALDDNLLAERERQAQNMVEATYTLLQGLQKRVTANEISLETAKDEATHAINAIRYGEEDYIWINDLQHIMIVHPTNPKLNGQDVSDFKDPDGKMLFQDIVKVAKTSKEGSIEYRWPKPGFTEPVDKISYVKLFEPWGWVIGTGVYLDEVQATFWAEAMTEALIFLLATIIIALGAFMVSKDISTSVDQLSAAMKRLAKGHTEEVTPLQGRQDEVGEMAHSVEYFRAQMIENEQLAAHQREEEEAQRQRARIIQKLANEFDMGVNIALQQVASAAQQLDMTANGMSATATQTSTQASAVASASQQTASNVETVAAASEELTASIHEVGQQVAQSSQIAQEAAHKVTETQGTVRTLSETASRISEASKLIGDIADQTNMLALNATIEAARAGEAGKGFAVVASEVKTLATQTGRATEEIAAHVNAIQKVSHDTVEAISEINHIITEMNEIAAAVAAAVEEQDAATSEIARNIEQASLGTQEVNQNILHVNNAANDTGTASKEVLHASSQLNDQSTSLRSIVEGFLKGVKSA